MFNLSIRETANSRSSKRIAGLYQLLHRMKMTLENAALLLSDKHKQMAFLLLAKETNQCEDELKNYCEHFKTNNTFVLDNELNEKDEIKISLFDYCRRQNEMLMNAYDEVLSDVELDGNTKTLLEKQGQLLMYGFAQVNFLNKFVE
jgi:hypothetical protein